MSYVTQTQITAALPPERLRDALDDDRDGVADAGLLDQVIARASQAVDGYLASRFAVPFTAPVPPVVGEATAVFTLELLYARRLVTGESNPWKAQADTWRERLQRIGAGELPLDASIKASFYPGAIVSESLGINDVVR